MRRVHERYVLRTRSKGKDYFYFRGPGWKRGDELIRLPDAEADRALRVLELISQQERTSSTPVEGSIASLIADYRTSPNYTKLSQSTRRNYDRDLDRILEKWGKLPVAGVKRSHCVKFRNQFGDRPRTANHFLSVLSLLFTFSVDLGYRDENPAARIGRLETHNEREPWSDEAWEAFQSSAPPSMVLAASLSLYTGQRQGDVLRIKWGDISGGFLTVRQSKTNTLLAIPIHSRLDVLLSRTRKRSVHIVTDAAGKPYEGRADTFRHHFRKAILAAGLDGFDYHGLRHTAATRLAEAGCTDSEIAAITGHKSVQMVKRYRQNARQKLLSRRAMQRYENPETE